MSIGSKLHMSQTTSARELHLSASPGLPPTATCGTSSVPFLDAAARHDCSSFGLAEPKFGTERIYTLVCEGLQWPSTSAYLVKYPLPRCRHQDAVH
jgi:hypothetical protein